MPPHELSIEEIVWESYEGQSARLVQHGLLVLLPDERSIYVYGTLVAIRAETMDNLVDPETKTIDLTGTGLSGVAVRAVLDHIHGGRPKDDDFAMLKEMLNAANYCGAEACKLWIEKVLIEHHILSLDASELLVLTETAHATHAEVLFAAAGQLLAERAPKDILIQSSSAVLAELIDRHVEKRSHEFAVGDNARSVTIYDPSTGNKLRRLEQVHQAPILALTYAYSFFATCAMDSTICIWQNDICLHSLMHRGLVLDLTFCKHEDAIYLVSASNDQVCMVWDTVTGICLHALRHRSWVHSLASSDSARVLASGCRNRNIFIWCLSTWRQKHILQGHTDTVFSLAFSPDSTALASGSWDHSIRLWSTQTWACLRILTGHALGVLTVAWNPFGTTLLTGSKDKSCRLWNIATGECIREFNDIHSQWVNAVCFSSDGAQILSCSTDQSICIHDPRDGTLIRRIKHESAVFALAFRPGGKKMLR